jgi:glycosyltransferase involved in cell wall biosynthesis
MRFTPLVSIITPSYNQSQFIEDTIQSVIQQEYPNIEYIIIDGGSTDQSEQIIRKHSQNIAYWCSEPDNGQAHAINKGLKIAKGELLGWLNADDILLPNTVSLAVSAFKNNPEIDVVYGHLERINQFGEKIPTPILPKDKVEFSKKLIVGECVVNQPGSFWRRKAMEKVGMLDEGLRYGLDYEFWIRLALAGAQFIHLPHTVACFRLSKDSKTVGETEGMALEQLEILDRVLSLDYLPQKIGLSSKQIIRRTRKTRSAISLHAFYGYYKKRNFFTAGYWLFKALQQDPLILFQRRWLDLALANISQNKEI